MSTNYPYDDFLSILESTSPALIGFNAKEIIVFANSKALSLCGYTKDEVLGKLISDLLPSENQLLKKNNSLVSIKKYSNRVTLKNEDVTFIAFLVHSFDKSAHSTKSMGMELLYKTSGLISKEFSFEESLSKILSLVCESIGWPVGHVYLVREETPDDLYPSLIWYLESESKFQEFKKTTMDSTFKIGKGLPGRILKSGKVEWITNVQDDTNFSRSQECSTVGVKGAFGFPIQLDDKIVCVLEFFTPSIFTPNEELLKVMEAVSLQISLLFQRKSQDNKIASKAIEMELLYNAAALATKNYSYEESLGEVLNFVCKNIGWPVGHAYLLDAKATDQLRPSPIWFLKDETVFQDFKDVTMRTNFKVGIGLPGRILKSGKAEWITNVQDDTNFPRAQECSTIGVKGAFGFPVQVDGQIVCVLEFFTPNPISPDKELLKTMDAVSHQISLVFQIKKIQLELEIALDAKNRFLATMSHEIRTPIAVIMGATELLDANNLQGEQKEIFKKLKSNSASLLNLITNVLNFSKGENVTLESKDTEVNLQKLVKQLEESFFPLTNNKNVTFSILTQENLPETIVVDLALLQQILFNLIENALKFTKKGSVKLEVSKKENMLFFLLKDTGIGIEEKDLPHIFDKFQQGNSKDSREFGGSGLGLAICKQLVSLLGGEISVTSSPGVGTTFSFSILLKQQKAKKSPQKEEIEIDPKSLHGRILLTEDNEDNQLIISHFLKKTSCEVEFANHGAEALEKIKNTSFDLILMDMQMPVMDGYSATKAIREMEKEKHITIIALTANALDEDKKNCLDAGCDAYLSKPIKSSDLIKELSNWL